MNKNTRTIVAVAGIVFAALLWIYGSVLPLLKAQAYITAVQNVPKVRTVQEFESNFNSVFDLYSPVGGEEVAKFLTGNILQAMDSQTNQPENVSRELTRYIESKIYPDTRHYLSMANLYTLLTSRFRREDDYNKAIGYYLKAREQGPKLPPVLYGLFSLYEARGDKAAAKEVGETILKYWPQDTRISDALKAK